MHNLASAFAGLVYLGLSFTPPPGAFSFLPQYGQVRDKLQTYHLHEVVCFTHVNDREGTVRVGAGALGADGSPRAKRREERRAGEGRIARLQATVGLDGGWLDRTAVAAARFELPPTFFAGPYPRRVPSSRYR